MSECTIAIVDGRCQCEPHEFDQWSHDHTSLVHVLWQAKAEGLTLDDFDALASLIRASHWFAAVNAKAALDLLPSSSTDQETPDDA